MKYMDLHDLPRIGNWLMDGDIGSSAITMCAVYMTGEPKKVAWPRDPSDLMRCMSFLESCVNPDKHFPLIVRLSDLDPHWEAIRAHWGELKTLYEEEKEYQHGPKLYAKMKEIGL